MLGPAEPHFHPSGRARGVEVTQGAGGVVGLQPGASAPRKSRPEKTRKRHRFVILQQHHGGGPWSSRRPPRPPRAPDQILSMPPEGRIRYGNRMDNIILKPDHIMQFLKPRSTLGSTPRTRGL